MRTALAAALSLVAIFASGSASAQAVCERLSAQLAAVEGGGSRGDARAARDLERRAMMQERELNRAYNDASRYGCDGGYGRPPPMVCREIDYHIRGMRSNLNQIDQELDRARRGGGGGSERDRQRILREMARIGCGQGGEPRQAQDGRAPQGGLFAFLFGGPRLVEPVPEADQPRINREGVQSDGRPGGGGTFRTLCVRQRDGYYWPVSYATSSGQFRRDSLVCEASCPNQDVQLYVHRNPGEWSESMVSLAGSSYSDLEHAFLYRTEFVSEAKCEAPKVVDEIATDEVAAANPIQASLVQVEPQAPRFNADPTRLPVPRPDPSTPAEEVDTVLVIEQGVAAENGIPRLGTEAGETVRTADGREIRIVGPGFLSVQ